MACKTLLAYIQKNQEAIRSPNEPTVQISLPTNIFRCS